VTPIEAERVNILTLRAVRLHTQVENYYHKSGILPILSRYFS